MLLTNEDFVRLYNILVYGQSGSGKSTLGVTAPDPVILLGESQGFESIRDAALRLGKPLPPTFHVTHADQLRQAILALRREDEPLLELAALHGAAGIELPYTRPKTVVLDSLTEMMKLVCDEIDEQSPPRIAKDGLPERSKRFWGVLSDRSDRLLRSLRDLPYHVLMLALLSDREVGEGQERSRVIGPQLPMHKLGELTASVTNAVGVSVRTATPLPDNDTEYSFNVRFAGPPYMLSKAMRPLGDKEPADFSAWVERLDAAHNPGK